MELRDVQEIKLVGFLNYRGILTDYTNGDGMGGASEMVFSSNGANAYLVQMEMMQLLDLIETQQRVR